jgi:hypothetical protein
MKNNANMELWCPGGCLRDLRDVNNHPLEIREDGSAVCSDCHDAEMEVARHLDAAAALAGSPWADCRPAGGEDRCWEDAES